MLTFYYLHYFFLKGGNFSPLIKYVESRWFPLSLSLLFFPYKLSSILVLRIRILLYEVLVYLEENVFQYYIQCSTAFLCLISFIYIFCYLLVLMFICLSNHLCTQLLIYLLTYLYTSTCCSCQFLLSSNVSYKKRLFVFVCNIIIQH